MFNMNSLGSIEPLSISVAKPDGTLFGCIDDIIDEATAKLSIGINEQYQLSFDTKCRNGDMNNWYEFLQEGMYLFVDTVGLFKMVQPQIELDGIKETKSVTAYSCDSELEDKTCTVDINMGTKGSAEYIVKYDDGETEDLVNPYTGIPYDWILLYNTLPEQLTQFKEKFENGYYGQQDAKGDVVVTDPALIEELTAIFNLIPRLEDKVVYDGEDSTVIEYVIPESEGGQIVKYILTPIFGPRINELISFYTRYRKQLSLLDIVLESTGGNWTVGDIYGLSDGNYDVANLKFQFEIDEPIYSFLTNTLATTAKCVVNFDILNRRVNITPVENVGEDTGIVIGYNTLVNTLEIETDEDKLATRLRVTGGDDMEITRVNFGSNYVFDLSYKMNVVDSNGKRIYVSDELAAKYDQYVAFREQQREEYISLSKDYEEYNKQIDEIKYRVPNDGLKIDYGSFHQDELDGMLKEIKNQLATLKSLYKHDYPGGVNPDGSINEEYMKHTFYWHDYVALNDIQAQIECAIAVYPNYGDETVWTDEEIALYKEKIHAWETEWSLYGSDELKIKIDAYKQNMDLLAESAVMRTAESEYTIKTWDQLTEPEKAEYGGDQVQYKYDTYMVYYNYMVEAQAYLDELLEQIDDLTELRDAVLPRRQELTDSVAIENYFTEEEAKIIYTLLRDADYENENILTTSIDTVSEKLDHMVELLEDAKVKVSETSRPQITFTVDSDNLLALPQFKSLWKQFCPGNFISVQYKDNTYVRVRLVSYEFNPRLVASGSFSMTFSNFVQSNSYYRDWDSLLGNDSGSSVSSYSSGSGIGGGGELTGNDLTADIANTLITKLLKSETFGTRVTDVILDTIDVNALTARSAKFGGLANGTTIIDGKCIQTGYIIDAMYNGVNGSIANTKGSIINLETGKFNLGGKSLVYDGDGLAVKGALTADSLSAGGKTYGSHNHTGLFIDSSGNLYAGANNDTQIKSDGTLDMCNGKLVWDGSTLAVQGKVTAESGYIGTKENGFTIDSAGISSGNKSGVADGNVTLSNADFYRTIASIPRTGLRFAIAGKFGVDKEGRVYATDGDFTGKVVATEGHIGGINGWHIMTNKIYSGNPDEESEGNGDFTLSTRDFTRKINGFSRSGLRFAIGGNLGVKNDGTLYANGAVIRGDFKADSLTVADSDKNVFSWIDEKTRLWYGAPDGLYPDAEENDYLIDYSTGSTYRFDGEDWVLVTDYNTAIEENVATINQAMEELEETMQDQIDAKVQTWAQDTNPGAEWAAEELESHDGDLWFYTGIEDMTVGSITILPTNTYQYKAAQNKWVLYGNSARTLFDLTDGKSTIFYGTTSDTFENIENGDYLVDKTTNTTYKWNASSSQWENLTTAGNLYGTLSTYTAPSTAAKYISCSNAVSLYDGLVVNIVFNYGNTSNSPTLNVDNLGAKPIYVNGQQASATNKFLWTQGAEITFMYAGGHFTPLDATRDYYVSCSSDASAQYKIATYAGCVICDGTTVHVTFTNKNTYTSTAYLSLDSSTSYGLPIYASGSGYVSGGKFDWNAGDTVSFGFDGEYWRMGDTAALTTVNSYMRFEANKGLMIADMTSGVLPIDSIPAGRYNTLLNNTALQIRNGTTVIAEYGSGIKLYQPGTTKVAVNITSSGASFTGDITATSLTLGTDVSIDADDIDGLAAVATSGNANDINGLAPVATTGSYSSLSNKPTIPTSVSQLAGGTNLMYRGDVEVTTSNPDKYGVVTTTYKYTNSSGSTITNTTKTSTDGKYMILGKTTGDSTTNFIVSTDGLLTAHNAIVYGTIYASEGEIGGWKINSTKLTNGTFGSSGGFHMATSDINGTVCEKTDNWRLAIGSDFGVTKQGTVYCTNICIHESLKMNYTKNGQSTQMREALVPAEDSSTRKELLMVGSGFDSVYMPKPTIFGNGLTIDINDKINVSGICGLYCTSLGTSENDSGWIFRMDPTNLRVGNSKVQGRVYISNKTSQIALGDDDANLRPNADKTHSLGHSSYRWSKIYSINTTIDTSDEKEKDIIGNLDYFANDLIMSLDPIEYMWKDGDHRRSRMGFSAQKTAKLCKSLNKNLALVTASYKLKGDEEVPEKEYFGEDVDDNLLIWGMAHAELIAPMVRVLQLQDQRIKELEQTIKEIKDNGN